MSWRTVIVSSRAKLDLKMGYMVIRGEDIKKVYLDELAVLIIENPAVSFTGCLLEALTKKKVRVVFCDGKRSPYAELAPYYGSHDCSRKLRQQIGWREEKKAEIWRAVIREKIHKQAEHLFVREKLEEAALLESYLAQLQPGDVTNREGHAAKVYFNALFGREFGRNAEDPVNAGLNYGYGILLSAFNRAITSAGYDTRLGIHHDNVFNRYNLSSDLMEPFRILTDRIVYERQGTEFDKAARYALVNVLNEQVMIEGVKQTVLHAAEIYVRSVFRALEEGAPEVIRFYSL